MAAEDHAAINNCSHDAQEGDRDFARRVIFESQDGSMRQPETSRCNQDGSAQTDQAILDKSLRYLIMSNGFSVGISRHPL